MRIKMIPWELACDDADNNSTNVTADFAILLL